VHCIHRPAAGPGSVQVSTALAFQFLLHQSSPAIFKNRYNNKFIAKTNTDIEKKREESDNNLAFMQPPN
jgi:hypothetical protein